MVSKKVFFYYPLRFLTKQVSKNIIRSWKNSALLLYIKLITYTIKELYQHLQIHFLLVKSFAYMVPCNIHIIISIVFIHIYVIIYTFVKYFHICQVHDKKLYCTKNTHILYNHHKICFITISSPFIFYYKDSYCNYWMLGVLN